MKVSKEGRYSPFFRKGDARWRSWLT